MARQAPSGGPSVLPPPIGDRDYAKTLRRVGCGGGGGVGGVHGQRAAGGGKRPPWGGGRRNWGRPWDLFYQTLPKLPRGSGLSSLSFPVLGCAPVRAKHL